jgi:hypothetical protein
MVRKGQNKERDESERKVDEQQQQQQDQQQTEREEDGGYQQHFKRESLLTRIEDFLPSHPFFHLLPLLLVIP